MVKQFMRKESSGDEPRLRLINKKVITPSYAEVQLNRRSRSAKLRAAERIVNQHEQYIVAEEHNFSGEFEAGGWRRPGLLIKLRRAYAAL
jgi:16S rRNA (cytosine1402-N4)-methyltransferase